MGKLLLLRLFGWILFLIGSSAFILERISLQPLLLECFPDGLSVLKGLLSDLDIFVLRDGEAILELLLLVELLIEFLTALHAIGVVVLGVD
jgi:hypothetical protein